MRHQMLESRGPNRLKLHDDQPSCSGFEERNKRARVQLSIAITAGTKCNLAVSTLADPRNNCKRELGGKYQVDDDLIT